MPNNSLPPFNVPMPFGGVSEAQAYSTPTEGTCLDALNVLPRDPRTDRQRISQRPALVNLLNTQLNGANAIQDINEVVVSVTETIFKELTTPTEEWAVDPSTGGAMKAVAVDSDGYVYVAGTRNASNVSVWKLDGDDGSTLASYDAGATTQAIALTPNTDTPYVHVVGTGTAAAKNQHLWKLNTDLELQWLADIGDDTKVMYGVAVDDDGNVYVTGDRNTLWNGNGSGSGVQRNVWKLDSDGSFTASIDLGATINLVGLALLENRTVAVVGPAVSGVSIWWTDFSTTLGTGYAGTSPKAVTIDKDGRTIAVGANTTGINLWVFDVDYNLVATADVGGGSVDLNGVATDSEGNIFVVGDLANGSNVWKLGSDLVQKWAFNTGGTDAYSSDVAGVTTGIEGDIIIAQDATGSETVMQLATTDEQTIISVPRSKKYYACAGGVVKRFALGTGFVPVSGTTMHQSKRVFSTQAYSRIYLVDSNNYRVLDPVANTLSAWIPTAGNLPNDADGDGTTDGGKSAQLITTWRGRVVLAATGADPHNWFMSKVGDPLDWDYSPADQSESQAVAGNNSPAGKIGDVITALMPYSDDLLLFGCDASLWRMTGDPMAGGRIDLVSDITGVSFGNAWCKDPDGFVYLFGRNGGMFRMAPGGIPERLSNGRIEKRLQDVDTGANYIRMVWDHALQGVHLLITPFDTNARGEHYFWDKRLDSFWPYSFAEAGLDPTAVYVIDGDSAEDRLMIMGGRNGYLRNWYAPYAFDAPATAGGERNAIDAYVWVGPLVGGTDAEIIVRGWNVVMGENTDAATLEGYGGDSVEEAFGSTALWSKALTAGRNGTINERARGAAVLAKVSNNTVDQFFSIENMIVQPIAGGRVRVRS